MAFSSHIIFVFCVFSAFSFASASLRIVEAGTGGREGPTLTDGFEYCPSNRGYSIECIPPSGTSYVVITVNGKKHRENFHRYFAAGNRGPMIYPLEVSGSVSVSCEGPGYFESAVGVVSCTAMNEELPSPTSTPSPSPMAASPSAAPVQNADRLDGVTCVTMKGTDYVGQLSDGWVRTGGTGVTYEPNNNYGGTVRSDRSSVLEYTFNVPVASRYGITVDMETRHKTEHNDIWFECDGGFTGYWKKDPNVKKFTGLIKVYHNGNGRRKEAKTVDHKGYWLSSTAVYRPGIQYKCKVGGRSTMTTVHGIILFPCDGDKDECNYESQYYREHVKQCNV